MRRFVPGFLVLSAALFVALARANSYDRDAAALSRLMRWSAGQTLAEIGAGDGQLTFAAAKTVGPTGRVYTTELDEEKLAGLKTTAHRRKLENVTVIKADPVETNLPEGCCDGVFIRHVYHHFSQPDVTDASILRALKPGGYVAVIDFAPRKALTESDPVNGVPKNRGGHGIPKTIIEKELSAAGFELLPEQDWPGHDDYCVLARKPAAH
jgi:ubiquinone/menaquinone biosynthesis C-methylase UbiE